MEKGLDQMIIYMTIGTRLLGILDLIIYLGMQITVTSLSENNEKQLVVRF